MPDSSAGCIQQSTTPKHAYVCKVRHTVQCTGALMVSRTRHIPRCRGASKALPPAVSAQLDGQAGKTTRHGRPTEHGQQVAAPSVLLPPLICGNQEHVTSQLPPRRISTQQAKVWLGHTAACCWHEAMHGLTPCVVGSQARGFTDHGHWKSWTRPLTSDGCSPESPAHHVLAWILHTRESGYSAADPGH